MGPLHEVQQLVSRAELYFQRNEPGDREREVDHLDRALAIFERCAAKRNVEKVLALRTAVS